MSIYAHNISEYDEVSVYSKEEWFGIFQTDKTKSEKKNSMNPQGYKCFLSKPGETYCYNVAKAQNAIKNVQCEERKINAGGQQNE